MADPYVMARKPVIKSYEPQLERGNAKCPMKCEAEASGTAYEKYSRIFAHFNHLTGEAKVLAANNQADNGSSMTISVTCTSL